jgi:hypothetical protein
MFSASTPSTSLSKATTELSSAHIVPQRPQLHSAAKSIFNRRKNITDTKNSGKPKNKTLHSIFGKDFLVIPWCKD